MRLYLKIRECKKVGFDFNISDISMFPYQNGIWNLAYISWTLFPIIVLLKKSKCVGYFFLRYNKDYLAARSILTCKCIWCKCVKGLLRYVNRIVDRLQFDSKLKSTTEGRPSVDPRWLTFGGRPSVDLRAFGANVCMVHMVHMIQMVHVVTWWI